jgi:hypothetical protein
MPKDRLRSQLVAQRGGNAPVFDADGNRIGGARIIAKVVRDERGTTYRLPSAADYLAVRRAEERLALSDEILTEPIVQERVAKNSPFRVHLYGMTRFGDLFSPRQKVALEFLAERIRGFSDPAMRDVMICVLGRCADYWSSNAVWASGGQFIAHTFGRQALSIVWDYAEAVPFADVSGDINGAVDWVARVIENQVSIPRRGTVQQGDAAQSALPDASSAVWFTDPPYYDAVSYADLSDFFFVWHKRALSDSRALQDPYEEGNALTPKAPEAIQDEFKSFDGVAKDKEFYENKMARVFEQGRHVLREDGIGCVVFAHKSTEGWESLLSGMVRGGWTITGSWPIATERPGRLRSKDSAALATSVHLVCRPRLEDAGIGDWGDVLRELPRRVADWMERLQDEGVRGADLVFACIGPALEIYSRYSRVESADGREVPLAEYLEKVWEVVGRAALEHVLGTSEAQARNGAAGALEEDSRLTALFLWTLQSTAGGDASGELDSGEDDPDEVEDDEDDEGGTGQKAKGFSLIFDVARRFAQPLGIDLTKWERRVIETKKGVVRLIPVAERAKQLFGEEGAGAVASQLESGQAIGSNPLQGMLFPELESSPRIRGRAAQSAGTRLGSVTDDNLSTRIEATTLDRVHAAMLLQRAGRTNALRALVLAERERGPDFLRLANALSALYPAGCEEKRLLDAMLLAAPR